MMTTLIGFSRCRFAPRRTSKACFRGLQQVRTHMNHGGGGQHHHHPHSKAGPRKTVSLGLEAAQSTSNILRLLEASHGGYLPSDALSTVWHPKGLLWKPFSEDPNKWMATSPTEPIKNGEAAPKAIQSPRLLSISLSDDRTALVKLVGVDGLTRYISLLRMDSEFLPTPQAGGMSVPNDGWFIVRELVSGEPKNTINHPETMAFLKETVLNYLSIEHGGGPEDKQRAEELFHPKASLLTIGAQPLEEPTSEWTGPVGSFVEISRETYLEGVGSQTPHENSSKINDSIVSLDVHANIAAATVTVGNGAKTNVFCDHLLLVRSDVNDPDWKIVSKVFSSWAWTD